jgi:glycosyltransferase involved in cell wall biosynthesis
MKILVSHNFYRTTSGEDLVIKEDIRILQKYGMDVLLYTRSNKEIAMFNFFEHVSFVPNTLYSLRSQKDIKKIVIRDHPSIAVVQNVFPLISPSIYYTLHELSVPIVQLVYNYRLICANAILYTQGQICERCVKGNHIHAVVYKCFKNSRPLSALYAATLAAHRHIGNWKSLISAYVTPDSFLKKKLVEGGFPRERIFSVLNPFDVETYSPSYSHKGYFVYFGRVVREKGIFTLLKAIQKVPESTLIVVGGGEAHQEAEEVARNLGLRNVLFVGRKYGDELVAILRDALAIIVPTEWYDNSPLVIHQSFALGKPVIASNIDGIPEIVENGTDGLLFEPRNVDQLIECMRRLWMDENLRFELAINARAKAEKYFTAERRFKELMKVFDYARNNIISA